MGDWRPNARTNLDEIGYATTSYDHNDSHVIKYLIFFKSKTADGHHVVKYSKCHNSPTNGPTGTQLGWSHPIVFSTCPTWCGCNGNGRCLATAHCTSSSYGRLEAERVNQFCWNLVYNSKLRHNDSHVIKYLIFKNSKWRTAAMLENIRNAITRLPMDRLGRSSGGHILSCSRHFCHVAVVMAMAVA